MDALQLLTYLTSLVLVFTTLAGWGALVAVVINILKTLNVAKDGQAQNWNLGLNAIGLVALFALGVFGKVTPEQFNTAAATASTLLIAGLGFVTQFKASTVTHSVLSQAEIPVIGKSNTAIDDKKWVKEWEDRNRVEDEVK